MPAYTPKKRLLSEMPCQYLKGVGPRVAQLLEKCGISTVQDVLFHLPSRYQDRTRLVPMRQLLPGDWAVVEGIIIRSDVMRKPSRRAQLLCEISDNTGRLVLRFFHFYEAQKNNLSVGTRVRCYGEVRYGPQGLTLIHPEYQLIDPQHPPHIDKTLTPIYPSTEGLAQQAWRKITDQALLQLNSEGILEDYLPASLLNRMQLMPLKDALQYVHRPPADANVDLLLSRQHPTQLRLAFEELLAHHLSLRQRRALIQQHTAPVLKTNFALQEKFLAQLPFQLTRAQQRVVQEISQDLQQARPMLRLVQGDVGSGKTVVAALTALQAVANQFQAAFMAPTEILAEQHYQQFQRWAEPLEIRVAFFSGQLTAKQRQQNLQALRNGEIHIAIGTHALFQSEVEFSRLGLTIVDEQHRFGVQQRLTLREKGLSPHQLIMTATPIPRTLAMTMYADLAVSVIDELPPGRTPIKTVVINQQRREEVMTRVREACAEQRQVYWVCTLIEESEALQCQAAQATAALLQQSLPELHIGLVHGRLKSAEKEKIMSLFKTGEIDLLVATTVIEVGVDVPNASLMIIENAERLGLSQLHQLRGRVGRGSIQSFCVLLYQQPLSELAHERLSVMRDCQDGFVIAEKDLALRGPGELLGTKQTGLLEMRVANLQRDQHLFDSIQQCADTLISQYPQQIPLLIRRWLGSAERYQMI